MMKRRERESEDHAEHMRLHTCIHTCIHTCEQPLFPPAASCNGAHRHRQSLTQSVHFFLHSLSLPYFKVTLTFSGSQAVQNIGSHMQAGIDSPTSRSATRSVCSASQARRGKSGTKIFILLLHSGLTSTFTSSLSQQSWLRLHTTTSPDP